MPVKVSTNEKMDAVYDVLIDTMGTFSYILCRIFDKDLPSEGKYIVRGTSQVHFHSDIFDEVDATLEQYGIVCECVGGGTITHDPVSKTLDVYGRSQAFGQANHNLTVKILADAFHDYTSIRWNDEQDYIPWD